MQSVLRFRYRNRSFVGRVVGFGQQQSHNEHIYVRQRKGIHRDKSESRIVQAIFIGTQYTVYTVSQKTSQNCFRQNFVKCPPTLIIFGTKMAKTMKLCEVHSFSISPNLCQRTIV